MAERTAAAFTLVELLAAMVVVMVLVLVMVGMTNQANKIWRGSRARIGAFQQARNAFERVTSNLNQATLNTYFDYYDNGGNSRSDVIRRAQRNSPNDPNAFYNAVVGFQPKTYDRASDLQFVCGFSEGSNLGDSQPLIPPPAGRATGSRPTHSIFFQCPIGHVSDVNSTTNDFKNLTRVLNAVGYYIEFADGNDKNLGRVPKFITQPGTAWRYRLMELNQPSQNLSIYSSDNYATPDSWFSLAVDPKAQANGSAASIPPVFVVADNIIALVVRPKVANPVPDSTAPSSADPTEIAPNYAYDTKKYYSSGSSTTPLNRLSKNQLPPLVQVTLVAIDADSATRLANQNGSTPPALVGSTLFTDVLRYDADVASLEKSLQDSRLTYHTFVSDVSLPGAKWSETK